MDAADRARLDALRERAYGPGGGIHDDPEALSRLIELEDLALPRAPDAPDAPDLPQGEPAALPEPEPDVLDVRQPGATPYEDAISDDPLPPPPPPPPRRTRRTVLVATATVAAAVVAFFAITATRPPDAESGAGSSPSPSPTVAALDPRNAPGGDPAAETLMTISLLAEYAEHADEHSLGSRAPAFPTTTPLDWVMPIGRYYGWAIWVAGGGAYPNPTHCILAERQGTVHARCVSRVSKAAGGLYVALSSSDVPHSELPRPMYPEETIRFWWLRDTTVDVVLGRFGLP
jgi:hypothetical protein